MLNFLLHTVIISHFRRIQGYESYINVFLVFFKLLVYCVLREAVPVAMITGYLLAIVVVLSIFGVAYYYWSRRHLHAAAKAFACPLGISTLPILGNAHLFFCKTEDIFLKINSLFEKVGNEPAGFWFGNDLLIGIKNPVYLEKIMPTSKFAYKHKLYVFLEKYLGEGLVSASGLNPKYKVHRRIIQSFLDLKFVESSLDILQNHTNICMEKLEEYADKGQFDIHNITVKCFMDSIGEIILGHNINSQQSGLTEFCQASIKMYNLGFTRMVKPWLHPNIIYNFLPDKVKQETIISHLNYFIKEVIIESWQRRKLYQGEFKQFIPIVDRLTKFMEQNPNKINNEDLMNHLMTLFTAASDTLTIVSSFAVLCFGMYPEYQQKAVEEIREAIGETPRFISISDINKLTYLDMCIKDVLRLFPIAPYILRRTLQDFPLDKWVIPKEAAVVIPIFNIHRDESYWEHPNHFYPYHFLPNAVKNRPTYAYMPFSAGPRGCIGKTLANIELKLFLCHVLQRFEISADGKVPNIDLCSDISLRPKRGYNCKLTSRSWK